MKWHSTHFCYHEGSPLLCSTYEPSQKSSLDNYVCYVSGIFGKRSAMKWDIKHQKKQSSVYKLTPFITLINRSQIKVWTQLSKDFLSLFCCFHTKALELLHLYSDGSVLAPKQHSLAFNFNLFTRCFLQCKISLTRCARRRWIMNNAFLNSLAALVSSWNN